MLDLNNFRVLHAARSRTAPRLDEGELEAECELLAIYRPAAEMSLVRRSIFCTGNIFGGMCGMLDRKRVVLTWEQSPFIFSA